MAKQVAILIVSGALVIVGMLISYWQSESEMNDIATSQQTLPAGSPMNVSKSLDPQKSRDGVYSVQISDFKNGDSLDASVIDPLGSTVVTKAISKSPFQENFTISSPGTYELKIRNTAQNELEVTGIVGYYPQAPSLLDLVDIIILIGGLSGLAIGLMFLIRSRGRIRPS